MRAIALLRPGVDPKAAEPFLQACPGIEFRNQLGDSDELDSALIFGGDGTVHRYLPALHRRRVPTLVVPCGSGNDFAASLGIANRECAVQAWKQFCSGTDNIAGIDLGVIRGGAGEWLFCCVAGAGLDSEANARANRMPAWLRRRGGYLMALLAALARFKRVRMNIHAHSSRFECRGYLAAVANTPSYGSGMIIAPGALMNDGRLNVCVVGDLGKLKLLCCLPTVFWGGHTRLRQVRYFTTAWVRIETAPPLPVFADGEFICATPAEFGIVPGGLRVIVPGLRGRGNHS